MPVNDWDYLMGDKMNAGHNANTYTLEDWNELVIVYDRYLAPYLSISEPCDPLDARESSRSPQQDMTTLLQTITNLNKTIEDLRQQLRLARLS